MPAAARPRVLHGPPPLLDLAALSFHLRRASRGLPLEALAGGVVRPAVNLCPHYGPGPTQRPARPAIQLPSAQLVWCSWWSPSLDRTTSSSGAAPPSTSSAN